MQKDERPVEAELSQAEKRPPKKLWRRVIAATMALVLIAGLILGYAAQIRFAQLNYVGSVLEHAAAVTADNTDYLSENVLTRAWNILRYAVGRPGTYEEYEMYASLAIARTEYAEAIPYMIGCIEQYPGDSAREKAVLEMRLGSLYALCDDIESAVACFDRAVQLDPTLADAYLLRAQMNSLLGQQELVVADIQRYDELAAEDPAIRVAIGNLYESAGDYENAVKCYSLGLEQSGGTDPELLAARGRCYILQQNMDAARRDLSNFFANGGKDPTGEYNLMLGLCRMEAGEFEQALNSFHNALNAGYTQRAMAYSQCVLCAYIIGDYETVIADGEKALACLAEPQQSGPNALDPVLEGVMSPEELHHWIGLARMAQEDFAGAKAEFLQVEDPSKAPDGVLYYIGLCCASLGQHQEAVQYYSDSIEKGQMVSLCLYNRAVSYFQLEKLEEGLTDLVNVLQRNDDADATAAATQLLEDLGVELTFEDQ